MTRSRWGSVALSLAVLTLTSRIVGFGRSVVFSKTVGDTCLGDVYNAANQLPNVLFEIVAGGVLAGVVIPVVARHVHAGRRESASRTTSALITWTVLVLTIPALAALVGAHAYASVFAAASCRGSGSTLAALVVIFVPQIWLYGLAVVSAGVLQAHDRFLAAAAAPLASSAVVIGCYLAFATLAGGGDRSDLRALPLQALRVLGWGTTAGVLVLALATLVPLSRLGLRLRPRLRFAAGDTGVITGIAAAAVVGLILQQGSQLLIIWAAQQTDDPGALTRITWANAIYLLPFAVLVAPILQLAFPRLSAAAEEGPQAVSQALAAITPAVGVLSCLSAALLAGTAVPVARVFVLGPGSGRAEALAAPIAAFAPAVVGFALLGLASRTLLAQHLARDSGIATSAGWGTVIVAVLVVVWLVPRAVVLPGLSLAVSAGMIVGAAVGWRLTGRTVPVAGIRRRPLVVSALAAVPAGGITGAISRALLDAGIWASLAGALGCAAICTAIFLTLVWLGDRALLRQVWSLRRREPEMMQQ